MPDVTVVGGGPAGSLSSRLLAASGLDVVVLEEHKQVGVPMHCAGMLTPETIRLSGVQPDILGTITSADVVFPDGRVLDIGRRTPMIYAVDRVDLDQKLADKACEFGVDFRYGVKCNRVTTDTKYAVADTNAGTVRSDIIVGADGPSSKVATYVGHDLPREIVVGMQADIRFRMDDQDRMILRLGHDIAPGFFSWQLPMGDITRVGVCVSPPFRPVDYLKKLISISGLEGMEVIQKFSGKIPIGGRRTTYANRTLLIGDAAGQIKPVSGGGLYPIFKAAPVLCDTVNSAYQLGVFNSSVLALYERGWKRVIGKEISRGARMRHFYLKLNDEQMSSVGEIFDTPDIKESLGMIDFDDPSNIVKPILSQKGVKSGMLKAYLRKGR